MPVASDPPSGRNERWVIVTPARNEADRLPSLARSLESQLEGSVLRWIVVDDGSTDGTGSIAAGLAAQFPVTVLRREAESGLATGAAFAAFRLGAKEAWRLEPSATRIAKIDADVVLDSGYMSAIEASGAGTGIVGGVLANDRERLDHVRGALKAYSREAWELVEDAIPAALGWDVIDEEAVLAAGMRVIVVPDARAAITRRTGTSEGAMRGRVRAGVVSRWSGYHPAYFLLRLVRYLFRRPYGVGALAMVWGYTTAGAGPFPAELRAQMRARQRGRLNSLVRSPRKYLLSAYGRMSRSQRQRSES